MHPVVDDIEAFERSIGDLLIERGKLDQANFERAMRLREAG